MSLWIILFVIFLVAWIGGFSRVPRGGGTDSPFACSCCDFTALTFPHGQANRLIAAL
jgi:hypothetical protein